MNIEDGRRLEEMRQKQFNDWQKKNPQQLSPEGMILNRLDEIEEKIDHKSFFDMVVEFHKKMKILSPGNPNEMKDKLWIQRINHILEESSELTVSYNKKDFCEILDALCDLIYVACGTAYLMGVDFNEAFRRVHEANMKKECRPFDGDKQGVLKPKGWKSPELKDLIP